MRSIKPTLDMMEQGNLLVAAVPGAFNKNDGVRINACRALIQALRAPMIDDVPAANVLTADVSIQLAIAFNDAVAQIIKAHIPVQRGRVAVPKPPKPPKEPKPPKAPSGRRAELEAEWIAKREAKAQLEEKRKELQTLKRFALEMRESLEAFEQACVQSAKLEIVGMPPDLVARQTKLTAALDPIAGAFSTLRTTPCASDRLQVQVQDMNENWAALTAATGRWCASPVAAGKTGGVHKGKALPAWLDACRTLSRDIAEELRNLK